MALDLKPVRLEAAAFIGLAWPKTRSLVRFVKTKQREWDIDGISSCLTSSVLFSSSTKPKVHVVLFGN